MSTFLRVKIGIMSLRCNRIGVDLMHINLCDDVQVLTPIAGKMTYDEFQSELERADLSVRAFAELIGMRPNSISNYAKAGEVPSHLAIIVTLVAELANRAVDYKALIARLEISPKLPRGAACNGEFRGDLRSESERQGKLDLS
jgi:transcriptional regulator with XRE-family HTH domain